MNLSQSEIIRDEQTIAGIGYQDGYFRDPSKPEELWKLWNHEQRMIYMNANLYGSYMRFQRDSKRMVQKYTEFWKGLCWAKK